MSFNNSAPIYNSWSKDVKLSGEYFEFSPFNNFYVPLDSDKVYVAEEDIDSDGPSTIGLIGYLPEATMVKQSQKSYLPIVEAIGFNYKDMTLELYRNVPVSCTTSERKAAICAKVPLYIETIYGNNRDSSTLMNIDWEIGERRCKIDTKNEKMLIFDTTNHCIVYVKLKVYEENNEKMDKTIKTISDNVKNGQAFKIEDVASIYKAQNNISSLLVISEDKSVVYTLMHNIQNSHDDRDLASGLLGSISKVSFNKALRNIFFYTVTDDGDEDILAYCDGYPVSTDDDIYKEINFDDDNNIWLASDDHETYIRDIETGYIWKVTKH